VVDGVMGWTESEGQWPLGCSVFEICTMAVRCRPARAGAGMPAKSGGHFEIGIGATRHRRERPSVTEKTLFEAGF
jgi:hypothetical protein